MSHLINPQLVDGYVDDFVGKSVQGVYVGNIDVAPQERVVDWILKRERKARRELADKKASTKEALDNVICEIVRLKKRGKDISKKREQALFLREELERLEKIVI